MLDTTFDPKTAEDRLYTAWEASGAFKAAPTGEAFSIVIPPPNVTGSLHIGHALNNTLQDILARFERMRGKSVLWQPGMDHAGIATQLVVERQLAEKQIRRRDMGREKFVETVWAWKEESGGIITRQQRRLGASCDWSRERFTMDEGLSAAVLKVFVALHRQGLIYKDKRLVNWDPSLQTAVSDLEVENVEEKGKLWTIRYDLVDGSGSISVATTRPETMLGDTGVAVNPSDERYTALVGKMVKLPLTDRTIPIIADEHSDPEKGTGAVKITPAHDFNDFEVGKRHGHTPIAILDREAKLNDEVPERFRGLDRDTARLRVLEELEALGLIEKIEEIVHAVPYDEKTKMVVIEPMLTDQWYVDAAKLAVPAIAAVETGKVTFTPDMYANTYFHWMRNIQPWCISRQLWWGHQIPAWYDDQGRVYVEETEAAAYEAARKNYGSNAEVHLTRDEDVLDTWFSSALWPFSTLGWPEQTPELKRFYPTSVLVTMYDIIFFWVARMMMMGMHFAGDIPFHKVLIHARVVDEKGAKMSKTKGNVVDPLTIIDEFGADALRLTLAMKAAPGKDVRMGRTIVEPYRNFGTKLWNAARFCQMNECALWDQFDPRALKQTINKWIVGAAAKTALSVTADIEAFRFNDAAGALYHFVYDDFCAWYVELIKPLLQGEDEEAKTETRRTAAWVLDQTLKLLHPFIPFITEELWARLSEFGPKRERMLISETWPAFDKFLIDEKADEEIGWVIDLITQVRSTRAELNVPAGARIGLVLVGASKVENERLARYQSLIDQLARLEYSTNGKEAPEGAVTFVHAGATVALPLKGVIDFRAEADRLTKEIKRLDGDMIKIDQKLANKQFVERAPAEVIEEQRERRAEAEAAKTKLAAALARIEGQRA